MKLTQEQVIAWAREAGISTPWDQEPVPWKLLTGFVTLAYEAGRKDEREWQGLTDEDWIIGKRSADYISGAEWAEAKLKEKNGF